MICTEAEVQAVMSMGCVVPAIKSHTVSVVSAIRKTERKECQSDP